MTFFGIAMGDLFQGAAKLGDTARITGSGKKKGKKMPKKEMSKKVSDYHRT